MTPDELTKMPTREALINRPVGALGQRGDLRYASAHRRPCLRGPVSGPVWPVSGRLPLRRRPGQSDGTGPHQPVRRGEQHVKVVEVLRDPAVAGLGEPEVALTIRNGCSTFARTAA